MIASYYEKCDQAKAEKYYRERFVSREYLVIKERGIGECVQEAAQAFFCGLESSDVEIGRQ